MCPGNMTAPREPGLVKQVLTSAIHPGFQSSRLVVVDVLGLGVVW